MNDDLRDLDAATTVATTLATAFGRPLLVGWHPANEPQWSGIAPLVDPRLANAVRSELLTLDPEDLTPQRLTISGGEPWTALISSGPGKTCVVVAVPGEASVEDLTPIVSSFSLAISTALDLSQLAFILDNSADMICVFRGDGTTEYMTPSVERILGWPVDHFAETSAFSFLHPDDLDGVVSLLGETLAVQTERRTGRFRFRRTNGEWAWIEARGMVPPGRTDVAVVSARDVTVEVEALELAQGESLRYQTLLDASPQATVITQDGHFVYVNDAAANLMGIDDASDMIGMAAKPLSTTEPSVQAERELALSKGQIVGPFEATVRRFDGSTIDLQVTTIPTTWDGLPAVQVVAVDLTARRRAEEMLQHAALHDPLTGLPNRHLLADRIDQAVRRARRTGEFSALFFCDLDQFKVINDALGHSVGDLLIAEAADRLRALTRETDTVARFGGDEFVVLSHDLNFGNDITILAERIQDALSRPFQIAGHTMHIGVSTGVVQVTGGEERDELLSFADAAMYAAKENGRNRWVLFDPELHTQATDRLRIEGALRHSLDTGTGLAVHLQPEVDLRSRSIVGFEALVRWTGPEGTLIPPDRFLPVAGDAGLMHRVGGFMFNGAAQALARLRPEHHAAWIAVNASADELEHPRFASQIQVALEAAGVSPSRLCIEITEHSIMRDPAGVEAALRPLRNQGVAIAIDDFGTGYSSLSYLARFHPDYLKIDRSFVSEIDAGPTQRAIVEAVMHMAEPMGITTVAEGIETAEQAELLTELGCQLGQGWYFGRPSAADEHTEPAND